jgi:tripartite-type tricarboxylate transporter receptor subunit TctC
MIRAVLKAAGVFVCLGALPAHAADPYPSGPVRILVGFAAGGPGDVPARYLAQKLGDALAAPFIIENKPGAASMLAVQALLSQPRDGKTLLLCTHYDAINTELYKSVKYSLSDLMPISLISKYYQVLAVSKSLPVETMKDFVAYAKTRPTELNYGALGGGSPQEIAARQLGKLAGISMTGIMFRGAAPAMQEMLAGRLDLYFGPPQTIMPLYEGKQVKVLAVAGPNRLANAPEVPTLTETGLPIIQYGWLGLCAASGTPQPIVDVLNKEIQTIVASPGWRKLIEDTGSIAISTTPADHQKVIDETAADAGAVIKEYKMQID